MTAHNLFLEQAAQTHFERLGSAGHAHMQIEKAMIHALEGEGPGERIVGAAADAGKTGHRID